MFLLLLLLLLLLVVIHIESSRVKQEILSNSSPYYQFNYNLSIEFIFKTLHDCFKSNFYFSCYGLQLGL